MRVATKCSGRWQEERRQGGDILVEMGPRLLGGMHKLKSVWSHQDLENGNKDLLRGLGREDPLTLTLAGLALS